MNKKALIMLVCALGGVNKSFGSEILINNDKTIVQQVEIGNTENINNNGIIKGNDLSEERVNSGNGLSNFQLSANPGVAVKIDKIENNGLIEGLKSLKNVEENLTLNVGNGISVNNQDSANQFSQNILKIENNGHISGKVMTEESKVLIKKDLYGSGNGINNYNNTSAKGIALIGDIENTGNIKGEGKIIQLESLNPTELKFTAAGNGISNFASKASIEKIENKGNIIGKVLIENKSESKITTYGLGNGISNYSLEEGTEKISSIINNGIIEGRIETKGTNIKFKGSGNGISSFYSDLGDVENKGVIVGNIKNQIVSTDYINGSGNGIHFNKGVGVIKNQGVIRGKEHSIHGTSGEVKNYGLLIGKKIVSAGIVEENLGVHIELVDVTNGETAIGKIVNGKGGTVTLSDGTTKTILNGTGVGEISNKEGVLGTTDSYVKASKLDATENLIINGAGIAHGSLSVDVENLELKDSIINANQVAVSLETEGKTTLNNVIINTSRTDLVAINGNEKNNELILKNNSILNGNLNLKEGNDVLAIDNTVQINGNLNGGIGNDTLNLGEKESVKAGQNLSIFHEITGFEEINTNGNVTIFETAKIDEGNINIESGDLTLRVDPSQKDSNGYITGHALYNHTGDIYSNGGNLIIGLNGLGEDVIIATNGSTIDKNMDTVYDETKNKLRTNSLVLNAILLDDENVKITVFEDLPLPPVDPPLIPLEPSTPTPPAVIDSVLYNHLNKVYKSVVSAGEIGKLANTTLLEGKTYEESLGGLLTMLDQIYANNPYAYTLKSSRDSLKLFEDNMSYLTIKPQKHELIAQGKAIYTGVKNDNTGSGKNYYGFDTGHRNYNTTTSTTGGVATFEYGLSDKTSAGVVVGGNNQNVNFKGSSKIEGNSLYLGTFAKTEIDNFKFMSGLGYQYTAADADRRVSNGYDSFKTNDKYNINSYNAFVEAKYVYEGTQNWRIEPKTRLSYYYIDQGSVDEGYKPGQLSIEVDKANSKTADLEVGVDVIKTVQLEKGKLNNIFSLGVINTLGSDSKELKGRVIGENKKGSKFDIQGTELPRTSGKASYNLELEQANGMIYTAGVSIEFAEDYNRNINATVGIGYKF